MKNNNITYVGVPSDESIRFIKKFLRRREIEAPICFVGRQTILERVKGDLIDINEDAMSLPRCEVIQGAPGAGKTSLLRELRIQCAKIPNVVPLMIAGQYLSRPGVVLERFIEAVDGNVGKLTDSTTLSTEITGNAALVKGGGKWEKEGESLLGKIERGRLLWQVLEDSIRYAKNKTFLVLIDEAQRVECSPGYNINSIVADLRDGETGLFKVHGVFAGLSDTSLKLAEVGLSRQAGIPATLGPLSESESLAAVTGFLDDDRLGLRDLFTSSDKYDIAQALAVASEGWPRHLHYYLQGLVANLLDDAMKTYPTRKLDLKRVLDYGHKSRILYYRQLIGLSPSDNFTQSLYDIAEQQLQDGTEITVRTIAEAASEYGYSSMEVETFVRNAVHSGILEPVIDKRRRYQFPIPSLTTYMACREHEDKTLSMLRDAFDERMGELNSKDSSSRGMER